MVENPGFNGCRKQLGQIMITAGDKHYKRALEILTDLGTQYAEGKLDEKTLKEEKKKGRTGAA